MQKGREKIPEINNTSGFREEICLFTLSQRFLRFRGKYQDLHECTVRKMNRERQTEKIMNTTMADFTRCPKIVCNSQSGRMG